ncbi:MAG TPA: phosphoribosylformylglycinamidine synthase I [Elusimicrobiota bacterium]|nr:phosphoribosylformylglycinamidine synthase I [Elusimicrobiota bacterium]
MTVRAVVLRCAGTNCDEETAAALRRAGAEPSRVHVNRFLEGGRRLNDYDLLVIPGGFSYGDDIASGKVLANQLSHRLKDQLDEFIARRKPVIGICNGFQALLKGGFLPGRAGVSVSATLTDNDSGKFECRWTFLRTSSGKCPFVRGLPAVFPAPVAHGEGKFVPESEAGLRTLEKQGQIVFRYVNERGQSDGYPWNPNGSRGDVAGICNREGNVLGLMPHPERYFYPQQHSHWTRIRPLPEHGVGLQIFKNAVRYAAQVAS